MNKRNYLNYLPEDEKLLSNEGIEKLKEKINYARLAEINGFSTQKYEKLEPDEFVSVCKALIARCDIEKIDEMIATHDFGEYSSTANLNANTIDDLIDEFGGVVENEDADEIGDLDFDELGI